MTVLANTNPILGPTGTHVTCSRSAPLRQRLFLRRALTAVVVATLFCGTVANGYTPESPEVKRMVERGIRYIETNYESDQFHPAKLGKFCLAGLAVLKHSGNTEHRLVKQAVEQCRQAARNGGQLNSATYSSTAYDNYSVGIALLFLCELDAQSYRTEIDILLDAMLRRQKTHGGWGYSHYKTGDTSQTQYSVLGLWVTNHYGINVPQDAAERVCGWLLRTQAPQGNWGYQGVDSGTLGQRKNQNRRTLSLAAAGLGSTYICADLLSFIQEPRSGRSTSRLPNQLREVGASRRRSGPVTDQIPNSIMQRALRDGNDWFAENYNIDGRGDQHYYMYALERYMSFRELAERRPSPEPYWYNDGVEFLKDTQDGDGHWASSQSQSGPVIDTAFSILFLLRSTRESIGRNVEESGRLTGGKLLPSDLSQIKLDKQGQVVSTKETPPVDNLLTMLEDLRASDIDPTIPKKLTLAKDPAQRTAQVARLRRLAVSGSYQARLTAVKTLGRDRDLGNVPALIAALDDPDQRVGRAARDGLRFISRKVDGFGLSNSASESEVENAVKQWTDWYESVEGARTKR